MQKHRAKVIRQWELVFALSQRRRGLSVAQLMEATGASRATVYRDLETLREAGAPIAPETVNGQVRYQLLLETFPPLAATALQIAALQAARVLLEPLQGTRMFAELNELLQTFSIRSLVGDEANGEPIAIGARGKATHPECLRTIGQAIRAGKRASFLYWSVSAAEPRERRVDPLSLRFNGQHMYLNAFDIEAEGVRTFKIARMSEVNVLDAKAQPHPDIDEDAMYAHAAKAWTGDPEHVLVRLSAHAARFASEWPLADEQRLEPQTDGSVLVHAQVAGTVEAMRWVLSWGQDAEAIAPTELRVSVREQLAQALSNYRTESSQHV